MTLNVLWRSKTGAEAAKAANAADLPDLALRVETDPKAALDHRDWFTVLVDGSPDARLLDAPHLRHVIVPFVGVNDKLRDAALERPELSVHNSHFNDAFVAQHAVALLMAVANRIVPADRALRGGDWTQGGAERPESLFLEDRMCLLLGYGAIGQAVESRVRGLGMRASAYRRSPEPSDIPVYGPNELHAALAQADAVVCSLPSTPATKHLLDADAIAAMKDGSILVNVGRGDVVDERALYDALLSSKLFGAGLDVWWRYPENADTRKDTLASSLPFHELDNVVMSPHRANEVAGWQEASFRDVLETLHALARGESRNRVDVAQGY